MPKTDRQPLTQKLKRLGVSAETIDELLINYPTERIRRQLDMLPYRSAHRIPARLLVCAIRGDWSAPKAHLDALRQTASRRVRQTLGKA